MRRRELLAAIAALTASSALDGAAASETTSGRPRIARVFTGPDGKSHVGELQLAEHEVRAGVVETEWLDASKVSLRFLDPGPGFAEQPRHVAPRRNLSVILAGTLELECSPSEVRRFGPGSLVLLEDTTGEGHITRVAEAPVAFVQIALGPATGSS